MAGRIMLGSGSIADWQAASADALALVHPPHEVQGHREEAWDRRRAAFAVDPVAVVRCGHCKPSKRPMVAMIFGTTLGPLIVPFPALEPALLLEWDFSDPDDSTRAAVAFEGMVLRCGRHLLHVPPHEEMMAASVKAGTGLVMANRFAQSPVEDAAEV